MGFFSAIRSIFSKKDREQRKHYNSLGNTPYKPKKQSSKPARGYTNADHKNEWIQKKKQSGNWLSKEEYERKTGKRGRNG